MDGLDDIFECPLDDCEQRLRFALFANDTENTRVTF